MSDAPRYLLGGPVPAWPPPGEFWVTRDSDLDGEMFDFVEVWTTRPVRLVVEGIAGAWWMTAIDWDVTSRWGRYLAVTFPYTLPDDDYQVIHVGG